ncbi:ArsR/SmtB family transcription factor [Kitasatospora sp. NPDC056327]|uniref:ArsR/SmtB family transcription factor n=1 Tax=Kitasatospora sp. NPDC056327 TaxID=3345785 RepID=UPI0035D62ECC
MMLRIHFTAEDLARVVLAPPGAPRPGETVLSLQLLRRTDQPLRFDHWRRQVLRRRGPELDLLDALVPPGGWVPELLAPHREPCEPCEPDGAGAVAAGPARRIAAGLAGLDRHRRAGTRPPGWVRRLADGDRDALDAVTRALAVYHARALAPYERGIRALLEADWAARTRTLATGGVDALLSGLHPAVRWRPPVLEVRSAAERDVHLGGRGLTLVPLFFCGPAPRALIGPVGRPAIAYPVPYDPLRPDPFAPRRPDDGGLAAALGRTRAAVLREVAAGPGATTGSLARTLGVSLATASEHAAVLRRAGLLTSHRHRSTVLHTVTPLGTDLLDSAV